MNTIADRSERIVAVATEVITGDVAALLKRLAAELLKSSRAPGLGCGPDVADGAVLLDVEVGGVRFLAVRQGRPSPISLLSPREQEIARMVASGYPNKTIASVLEISSWTVASHLRRIFVKLQVSSRAAMAARLSGPALNEPSPVPANHAAPPAVHSR